MAQNAPKLAGLLGATIVGQVPECGGGAFGAARMAKVVADLRSRRGVAASSSQTDLPISPGTRQKLTRLAARLSVDGVSVSPNELAGQLLDEVVAQISDE